METLFSMIRQAGIDMPPPRLALKATAHEGASTVDHNLAKWIPMRGSADADLLPDLDLLVSRSRDLGRNNGIASGANQTAVDNVVGTGLRLSSTPDYRALGRDKEWAEEWSSGVEALWRGYSECFECDASGMLTFAGQTQLVFRSGIGNGEALALPLWLPDPRSKWATRFLLVESDRLSNPNDAPDTEFRRGGIEINQNGRPLAYWIRANHPGDWLGMLAPLGSDWERVPADTAWGRRRVLHVHDMERTGQRRGKPWYTPILPQFKMFDQYTKAELKSAVVSALVAAFIETPLDSATLAQSLGADPTSAEYQNWLTTMRQYVSPLQGGALIPMPPGTKINPFNPARPSNSFEPFVTSLLRHVAVGLNMPYELVAKDFSKTNYSSARAALLEGWRFFRSRRHWLATNWATPVYTLWLEEAINRGYVEAPDFYENISAYTRCRWIGGPRGWVDPVKEAEAAVVRMNNNISTLEEECAEQGLDWEEVLEQRAREQKRITELGLTVAPDQRPEKQPAPQEEREEEVAA